MNMTSRNAVLGVICLLLAVPTFMQLNADADTFVDLDRVPLMFRGFTSENVGSILLALPKDEQPAPPEDPGRAQPKQVAYDQLLLKSVDGKWTVGQLPKQRSSEFAGAPVMQQRIENDVFHHLRMIRNDPATFVQSNATDEQLAKYGLDDERAYLIRVIDKSGKTALAELLVGDDSSIGRSNEEAVRGVFVRQRGSNDVVLYEWEKPWRRSVDTDEWLDRVLTRVEPDKVRKLTIRNSWSGGKSFVFEREPGKAMWKCTAGGEDLGAVRQTEVEGLTQRFRYLSVQSFERPLKSAGDMQALGLFPPAIEISIVIDKEGVEEEVRLAVGKQVAGRNVYYMTCSLVPFVMTWSGSLVTQFELDIAQRLFDPK
jgi:hypothetical protein